MDGKQPDRAPNGQFAAGNAGGPGRRPGSGASALRQAIAEAITPEHLQAVMRKALLLALNGNLSAMRFVTEQACGKPSPTPGVATPLDLTLPSMRTAEDCDAAIATVMRAVCEGTIDRDAAKLFTEMIQVRVRAIEARDVERRLSELERMTGLVQLRPG